MGVFGAGQAAVAAELPSLQLVESWPQETSLDHADLADAHEVWLQMIGSAKRSLDIAQFYISPNPDAPDGMDDVLRAITVAAGRGVSVRIIADAKFAPTYPDDLKRLSDTPNIDLRIYDMKPLTGGVMHAKYFIVDGADGYLGSQNFDWRSLAHIVELGVRFGGPAAAELQQTFDDDWQRAAGGTPVPRVAQGAHDMLWRGEPVRVDFVSSPKAHSNDWDLPKILALLAGAQHSVRVQLLSYAIIGYDKREWHQLDQALRAAAQRGVDVQLLVSDWQKSEHKQQVVKELTQAPHIRVRFVNIPQHSAGWIDYARTIHSKYLVVDDRVAWVGTSNWSRDYFYSSRNVGLIVEGVPFARRLSRLHAELWDSAYAEAVEPAKRYLAPFEERRRRGQ